MKIRINTIAQVKNLCEAAMDVQGNIYASQGRLVVDATSIMGLFSLNLLDPIILDFEVENDDDLEEFKKKIKTLEVEDE